MTAPKDVTIGRAWQPKRGRKLPALVIAQIYRPDRQVMVYVAETDSHRVLSWVELRRDWKPSQ
jgi:hypothetical protein